MAIYSLNLGFISRSAGRSAVGFSAYISGGRQQDERTGVIYNYGCKSDVIVSRILAPNDAPEWVKTSAILWNKIEQCEDEYASFRFRGDHHDPEKNQKSLKAKEQFLASAQPAQTIMGAIPIEFSKLEAEVCIEQFLKERFVSRGLVVEYAIHWDKGNPHFHGMITRRALIEGEFSQKKDREIVSKGEHNITRKEWEVIINKHLELGEHEVRIDSRSHEERGSLFIPTHHEGWYAQRLAERGQYSRIIADNEETRQKNIEILCENPAALIQEVSLKRTTFTRKHIEDEIIRRVGGDERLFSLLKSKVEDIEIPSELILKQANNNILIEGHSHKGLPPLQEAFATELKSLAQKFTDQILENKEITHKVGENINRDQIFASKAYKDQEAKLIRFADCLHEKQSKNISEEFVSKAIAVCEKEQNFSFSEEQAKAIAHLCSGPDIRLLNGRAGTGKTTLLRAVAQAYLDAGYRVMGTSFQGKAVEIMEKEIGIPCKTLDSLDYAWTKHQQQCDLVESGRLWGRPYLYAFNRMKELEKERLTSKDVIIFDEANMIGGRLWEILLKEASTQGSKVLIVQDPAQIKSREPGDYGRLFAERFGYCETREVVRQRISWQRECSKYLNDHHVLDGLKPYDEKGHLKWFEGSHQLNSVLAQDYVRSLIENPHKTHIALAYRNRDVYALNQTIREVLKTEGYLKEFFKIHGEEYALGERIRFTQNDHRGQYVHNVHGSLLESIREQWTQSYSREAKGVKNGSFGTIEAYDEKKSLLTVCLDDKKRVQFYTKDYPHIVHGYAMGIHKSEASTFDKTLPVLDPLMDPETLLVALTRHRDDTQVYVNREHFIDFKDIIGKLGKVSFKETLQDYSISEEQRPYFDRVQQYRDLIIETSTLREEMEGSPRWDSKAGLEPSEPLYKHPSYKAYQTCFEEKKRVAESILKDWQNHAPYVRLAGIRKDILEVEAGFRPRLLSELEYRASIQVQGYMDLVRETRNLWCTISQTHPASLAKSHALYEDYKSLKTERDSLAAVFLENLKLYKPFLRITADDTGKLKDYWGEELTKENRVTISSIKSHAESHRKSQLQNLYYERLSSEQKIHYDVVNSYISIRNEAATTYSHLQKQKNKQELASIRITSPETFFTLEKFQELQIQRDALALKVVESPKKYQSFFEALKVKEDKLLDHAVSGEIREKVTSYANETNSSTRAFKAEELKRILTTSKDHRIFKESGLEFSRLTFDIAFYEKIKSGEIPSTLDPNQIYKPIQNYLNSSKEAVRLWKIIQLKPHDKDINSKDLLKKDWQLALTARNENATALLEDKAALSVISSMREGIHSRLVQQAGYTKSNTLERSSSELSQANKAKFDLPLSQVLQVTKGNCEKIIADLLGSPNKFLSSKTELRFGKKGSLLINIAGSKEGLWKDFETGEGGNIFQLIQREKKLGFKEAVSYLAHNLNIKPNAQTHFKRGSHQQKQVPEPHPLEEAKEIAQRLNGVLELQMKSKPIQGTLAETYLRKERGILGPLAPDLRYIPQGTTFMYRGERKTVTHPCFAVFGRNHEGCLSSVQLTRLDYQGKRALTREGEKLNKIQYGISKGSFVTIQGGKSPDGTSTDRVFITEGIETALSIKEGNIKGKIVASLGIHNISNYPGPEKEIIICADNDSDKLNSQTHKIIETAQEQFRSQGKSVLMVKPAHPGDDFNDVLKKEEKKGIQDYVKEYLDTEPPALQTQRIQKAESLPQMKADQPSPIAKIASYLEAKIKEMKTFEGTYIADQARKELETYAQIFAKNENMLQNLKLNNQEVAKEVQTFLQCQRLQNKKEIER